MQLTAFMLAAALSSGTPLPTYVVSDAKGAIENGWEQLAHRRDRQCEVEVTGNGQFFRISMSGFAPGEIGLFHLSNEDIKPVRYRFQSDENGEFSKIYLPFLWHRQSGVVSVNAQGEGCDVTVWFPWMRASPKFH